MARNLSISLPAYQKVSFKAGKHWKRRSKAPVQESQLVEAADGQLEMPIFQEVVNR